MIKAIFIDMDDTLIVNNILYEKAQAALAGFLHNFGITEEEVDAVFDRVDAENFKTLGYSRERMPASFEMTLKHFIPDAEETLVMSARGFAEKIFTTIAPLKPDVEEAFALMVENFPVYLVTQGDLSVQAGRVAHIPFKGEFADIHIVERKHTDLYKKLLKKHGFKPEEVVMIGDSLKSDIVPAVEAGMHAIWIEARNASHEAIPASTSDRAHKFGSLLEAAQHLATHGTPVRGYVVKPKGSAKHAP